MVKTNIPFRFKENIINFYFKIAGLRDQISEKYWKTPIGLRARPKIPIIVLFTE